ncbi:MAG TPA: MBL fold metallo-hydrolase [Euryarchaeota archaeon]|nr:MBL fold metallo-hydrolase [Euryarchaeota archaeon]
MDIQMLPGVGFECNSYLIRDEKSILVDVGSEGRADELKGFVTDHLGGKNIDKIVLTHTHYDHAGGARRMQDLTGAKILVHPAEGERLSSGDNTLTLEDMFGERMRKFEWSPIDEGSRIETGTGVFEVMHLPGHSIGSIGLWEESSRSLIVGDTVFSDGGIGRYDLPSGDFRTLVSSIERLSKMEIENLYPGHGGAVFGDGSEHVRMSLGLVRSVM